MQRHPTIYVSPEYPVRSKAIDTVLGSRSHLKPVNLKWTARRCISQYDGGNRAIRLQRSTRSNYRASRSRSISWFACIKVFWSMISKWCYSIRYHWVRNSGSPTTTRSILLGSAKPAAVPSVGIVVIAIGVLDPFPNIAAHIANPLPG